MNVKEMVTEHLKAHGFTGLCSDECGCTIDDLMPCSDERIESCEPGYAVPCPMDGGECDNCGQEHVLPDKPRARVYPGSDTGTP